ncbi:2'-5' RNA ligase family protein [Pseudonocardia pini]|uniref:2'-5' RNA ligase family protein n=1 Tax=Pseudonocardia pini TaxID=2758030 RepID=UPI0015F0D5FB|nr:2'-5' RNA ligase family protein [Pseudonocardia pini]
MPPLVVTAVVAEPVQEALDALRRRHFPPDRNHLDAHVTLFHALPAEHEAAVAAALAAATERPGPEAVVGVPRLLGRGVALRVESPALLALRADLAHRWDPWLTRQDRGKRELHVTVQNKVDPEQARALYADLATRPVDHTHVTALALWRYRGGPWEPVRRYPFGPAR